MGLNKYLLLSLLLLLYFIYSFSKDFLSSYCGSDTVLGPGDIIMSNKKHDLSPQLVKDQLSLYFVEVFSLYYFLFVSYSG